MGVRGGRNMRGIEGDPNEESLYQRLNISMPPSVLRSWCIQKAVNEWLKKKGY